MGSCFRLLYVATQIDSTLSLRTRLLGLLTFVVSFRGLGRHCTVIDDNVVLSLHCTSQAGLASPVLA